MTDNLKNNFFGNKLTCLLCGRNKFTKRQAHRCGGNFRKRRIKWAVITTVGLWRYKSKTCPTEKQ